MQETLVVKIDIKDIMTWMSSNAKVEEWVTFHLIYPVFDHWSLSSPSDDQSAQKKNPQMSTFHKVSFLISPLWSTLSRVLAILSWWSWFLHHAISSSPSWGKVWTLCISTQSRTRRSRKARAVTRRILSFGCSRRWWLCARVPGRPVDRRSLSAGEGQRT